MVEELERRGFATALVPVTNNGLVDLEALAGLIGPDTLLVSVMGANNEVGVVQPLVAVANLAHAQGALVHSDLAQLAGKLPLNVVALDLDYASLSAHKLYGPMGVGALYISGLSGLRPQPIVFGGGQEGGLRAGTLPTPLIVGFGAAAGRARDALAHDAATQGRLAERLLDGLARRQVRYVQNAQGAPRLPGSLSLRFRGVDADALVGRLSEKVCLSTGSACSSGQINASHVLRAMSLSEVDAASTIRIYINIYLSDSEIDYAVECLSSVLQEIEPCGWTDAPVGSLHEIDPR